MPNRLDDQQLQQYRALNDEVGFVLLGRRTQIVLTGSDREKFLNNFCTNDITALSPGDGCEAFITNVQGKILAFVHVACNQDSIRLETVPGQAEKIIAHLDRYLIMEDVEISDATEGQSLVAISGSKSAETLNNLFGCSVPGKPNGHINVSFQSSELHLQTVRATCEDCFFVSVDENAADPIVSELEAAGAARCSLEAWETCRVEAGFPEYGRDITDKNLPQEVGRNESAISFTKGCYLGQETVARIDALGHVNWHLVGIRCDGPEVPEAGTEFKAGDSAAGSVNSACFSPKLSSPLAMGYIRRQHAEAGTKLSYEGGAAEVVALPLS